MQYLKLLLLVVIFFLASGVSAQTDPKVVKVDSTLINPDAKKDSVFRPKKDSVVNLRSAKKVEEKPAVVKDSARLALERLSKVATRRSMIVPGWGQLTNHRWWKVPILYGGFVSLALAIDFNQKNYKKLLNELQHNYKFTNKIDTLNITTPWIDPVFANYDRDRVIDAKDFYHRNRDFCILLTGALYVVNIIDAYVDATFFRFDVSNDLSLRVAPSYQPGYSFSSLSGTPSIKLTLSFGQRNNRYRQLN